MSDQPITIETMQIVPAMPETLRTLDIEPGTYSAIACYRFTASGSGNTGTACFVDGLIILEWGGDPQAFYADDQRDDEQNLTDALNGELPDA